MASSSTMDDLGQLQLQNTALAPIPLSFICPISRQVLKNPVAAKDGHLYESWAMQAWLSCGNQFSPVTGEKLTDFSLISDPPLGYCISLYLAMRPELQSHSAVVSASKAQDDNALQNGRHADTTSPGGILRKLSETLSAALSRSERELRFVVEEIARSLIGLSMNCDNLTNPQNCGAAAGSMANNSLCMPQECEAAAAVTMPTNNSCTPPANYGAGSGTMANNSLFTSQNCGAAASAMGNNSFCTPHNCGPAGGAMANNVSRVERAYQPANQRSGKIVDNDVSRIYKIASGSGDHSIKVWERNTGNCLTTLLGHKGPITGLVCPSDGAWLASSSVDCKIKLWDVERGKCFTTLHGRSDQVTCLAVTGVAALASGSRKSINLWDMRSGRCVTTLPGHSGQVSSLVAVGEAKLASASLDKTIKMWDLSSCRCDAMLEGHDDAVLSLATLGTSFLASGSDDKSVRLWHLATGTCPAVLKKHRSRILCLGALHGDVLASGSADALVKLWDVGSGRVRTLQGHSSAVNAIVAVGETQFATGSDDASIKLWESHEGTCLCTLTGHSKRVLCLAAFSVGVVLQ